MRKLILGTAAAALAVPAITLAGPEATSGDQSLSIFATANPLVGKGPLGLDLTTQYRSLNDGAQVKESTKSIKLTMPKGWKYRPAKGHPACKVSEALQTGESACPDGSRIGTGTGTADARPTLPDPVPATIVIFNALDDTMPDGSPRSPAVPAVLLSVKTDVGFNTALPFDVAPNGNTLTLDYAPPQPGDPPQLFHIQDVKLKIPRSFDGRRSPIFANAKCTAKRRMIMTIENYDGPSVSAHHDLPCKKKG